MKTITPTQVDTADRKWYIVDAKWQTLWRLATGIAKILKWKNKVDFIPHLDNGDYVIVKNCDQFVVTWKKTTTKIYHTHSWYLWGLKSISLEDLLIKKPSKPLELAVNGMLPKNKLRKWMLSRLKLFNGDEHTFIAQKPEEIQL
jgi:large subunit ribosomal protein L13